MPEDRAIIVETAEGDELAISHLTGFDEISRCFAFTVGLVGTAVDVTAKAMLGKPLAIEAESEAPKRWFHGLVTEFRLIKVEDRRAHYEAELRPWLWLLGLTCDCRIFQNMSVVEIIEEIFGKYPEAKFEKRLQVGYPPREYCVQYDESDLDFVQRLMEHEGIFYFFAYAEDGHTLVLCDTVAKLEPAEGYATVPFHAEDQPARRDRDFLSDWIATASVRPKVFAHTDYDFEKPALSLMAASTADPLPGAFTGEHYRQPGAHLELDRGDAVAALRREELQAPHVRVRAAGTARGLASGCVFTLEGFPREDQNDKHVVLRAEYRLVDPEHMTAAAAEAETYRVALVVAPAALPYRPPRLTPRPVMRGPQTATVVGPKGEEIYTDEYSRVKVHFHWDRLGKSDENDTCFIRVSATWAGAQWGFIQIPRIGQEVIVDFIEGDPDRPIITGRVYNAAQMPPYGLPANATQSGWKSDSSLGGGGFNELRFEDKKGSEEVYFQAEKDHNELVKNDESRHIGHDWKEEVVNDATQWVGHDRRETVDNSKWTHVKVDRTVNIDHDDTETVGNDRKLFVKNDEAIDVSGSSDEKIWKDHSQYVLRMQSVTVGGARFDKVGAAETRAVGAWHSTAVVGYRSVSVGGYQKRGVVGSDSTTVQGEQTVEVGKNQTTTVKGDQSFWVDGDGTYMVKGPCFWASEDSGTFKSAKHTLIEAGEQLTLKCGSASLVMTKDGKITVEGSDITVIGSGKINIKATGELTMKGSKINQN